MNRRALIVLGVFLLTSNASAYDWDNYDDNTVDSYVFDDAIKPRFLFNGLNFSSDSFVTINETILLFSGGILLWGIAGAMLLYYLLTVPADAGFDYDYGGGYEGSSQGYARSQGRSFNPHFIDWETFTILDWIAIAEETWKKFEPSNLECQKRLICEVHQNAPKFGRIAKKMVDAFSYLQYAEVLRLPEDLKNLVHSYLDAADRGRSMKKECGEIYDTCDFSVKKMVDKVSHNEI